MTEPGMTRGEALTSEDLERQSGGPLPDREAMSTITGSGVDNFAAPINEALAVNVESVDSYAIADADQIIVLNQVSVDDAPADDGLVTDPDTDTDTDPGNGRGVGRH